MIYFTSDTHLGHNKEFLYLPRGFKTIEEHNKTIVENWNNTIKQEDDVYILGDLVLGDIDTGIELLKQLNGNIYIIKGNHDTDNKIARYLSECKNILGINYAQEIKYKKHYFYLSHYPTITANYDDEKPWANHLINLHGHTHSKEKFYNNNPYMYNVSLDAHNNFPISIDEVLLDIKTKVNEVKKEKE